MVSAANDSTSEAQLTQQSHDPPPCIRAHRQEVDDVRPALPVLEACVHQRGAAQHMVGMGSGRDN
jgi:hypothetical protein